MVQFTKAIAGNTDIESAQVFVFQHDANLFGCLISGEGPDGFVKIRQYAFDLEELFFDCDEPVHFRFQQALNFLHKNLIGLESLQILLFALKNGLLYLQPEGEHKVILQRQHKLINLTHQHHGQLISGHTQAGDKLLILSSNLRYLPTEIEQKLLLAEELEPILEEVSLAGRQATSAARIELSLETEVNLSRSVETQPKKQIRIAIGEYAGQLKAASVQTIKTLRPSSQRSWRRYALVLIFLLVFGFFGLSGWRKARVKEKQFNSYLTNSQNELNQALAQKDASPDQAKQLYAQAKKDIGSALGIKPKDKKALSLQNQIKAASKDVLKVIEAADWTLFLDLNLIKAGFTSKQMSYSMGNILLLDPNKKTLVQINLASKAYTLLAGQDQLGSATSFSLNGDSAFSFSPDKGVVKVDTRLSKITPTLKIDPEWGFISSLVGFAGNVYLLDSGKNMIWKYIETTNSYSDKNHYFNDGLNPDLKDARQMLIDGSVWVLKSGAQLDRFTAGASDFFAYANLDEKISNVSAFFTSDDTDNLYVVDPDQSRILILKKNGQYQAQITGDKFRSISDLVVDEQQKKIYLLDSAKIYVIPLP